MSEYYDELTIRDMGLSHAIRLFSGSRPADEYPMSLVIDAADLFTRWLKGEDVSTDE